MGSNNLLNHTSLSQRVINAKLREESELRSIFGSEPDPNYVPRETEVIESPSDIQLLKRVCRYKDDGSIAWEEYVDQDGNEWVKREDVEDY